MIGDADHFRSKLNTQPMCDVRKRFTKELERCQQLVGVSTKIRLVVILRGLFRWLEPDWWVYSYFSVSLWGRAWNHQSEMRCMSVVPFSICGRKESGNTIYKNLSLTPSKSNNHIQKLEFNTSKKGETRIKTWVWLQTGLGVVSQEPPVTNWPQMNEVLGSAPLDFYPGLELGQQGCFRGIPVLDDDNSQDIGQSSPI